MRTVPSRLHRTAARLGVAAALSVAACGTDASPAADASTTDVATDRATSDGATDASVGDAVIGTFQVQLVAPTDAGAGYTSVVGRVQNGATPQAIVWETAATGGDCKLLTPRVPFCTTPCGGSAVCVENDTCVPYPTAQTVGTVHVTGVRTADGMTAFDLNPVANTYQPLGAALPYPAFAEGDAIRFEASGSPFAAAFALETRGIAPLALAGSAINLQSGQDLALTWTAPAVAGSRIAVRLDISHHGGTRGKIECDTADDGSLTIEANLITRLVALGVAGFPTIVVTRSNVGSAALPAGRVQLNVNSVVETAVTIPGLRSCTGDSDCDGGTCRADLTCQ